MKPLLTFASIALSLALSAGPALAGHHEKGEKDESSSRTKSPEDAKVYFISPADGAVVSSPFRVVFGLRGMGVAPAGVAKENTGHHHLFIDAPLDKNALDENIVADKNHKHFGGGQTETTLSLEPGEHTLRLVFADKDHIPHDPVVYSKEITIKVIPPAESEEDGPRSGRDNPEKREGLLKGLF